MRRNGFGFARRHVKNRGIDVDITTTSMAIDDSSDWDDEVETTETESTKAIVSNPRSNSRERTENTVNENAALVVYLPDDLDIAVQTGDSGNGPATEFEIDGRTFYAMAPVRRTGGILQVEVRSQ